MDRLYLPRKIIATGVLGALCLWLGFHWYSSWVLRTLGLAEAAPLVGITVGAVVALVGVATNRVWGRWLGLSTAVAAMLSTASATALFGTNLIGQTAVWLGGAAALFVALCGHSMASRYELRASGDSPWRVRDRRSALLNWAPILALAGTPTMLTIAALGANRVTFGVLSAEWSIAAGVGVVAVIAGVGLLLYQRSAGALLLIVAGLIGVAFIIAIATAPIHGGPHIFAPKLLAVLAASLAPLAFGGVMSLVLLAGPATRLLRGG